jgi:rsbT co-antagonist protein RsbR
MSSSATTTGSMSDEDRALVRTMGSHLSKMIHALPVEDIGVDRRDELGLLANMVDRAAHVISRARQRDAEHRKELEKRVDELERAHVKHAELLDTIRQLSVPVLNIRRSIVLVPIVGVLDAERAQLILIALLERIAKTRSRVAILDITGAVSIDAHVFELLLQATRTVRLIGAQVVLCGISPGVAQMACMLDLDFHSMTPHADLEAALAEATRMLA